MKTSKTECCVGIKRLRMENKLLRIFFIRFEDILLYFIVLSCYNGYKFTRKTLAGMTL